LLVRTTITLIAESEKHFRDQCSLFAHSLFWGNEQRHYEEGNMKNKKHTIEALMRVVLILAVAGSLLFLNGDPRAWGDSRGNIKVSYKLDPRLTQSLYMGERWVSPPTYSTAQDGQTSTVQARAYGVDAMGKPLAISPEWTPADPEMVTVSPSRGNEVNIIVKRAGQSRVKVTFQGISKVLAIKAVEQGGTMQVEITQ
jgi:hypothetical protein